MAVKRKAATKPFNRGKAQRTVGARPTPPERKKLVATDFFSALQRSLDAVQRQLSSANNMFADFVVKEFKVDAAVQMGINELGVLQLVLADDTMTPPSVSRVSLTLAAVAKISDGSLPKSMVKADATALMDLTWLPPKLAAQLAQYEVRTVSEFLGLVADARFATQIVSLLKVRRADIARWANQMRLLELPGMTVHYAEVLSELGIYGIADLAQLSEKAIIDLQRRASKVLTKEMLGTWHDAAKQALL
jgi:hypothetical protein